MDLFTYATTLTEIEQTRLQELEATVQRGITTFVDVGLALMEIRDSRLYRQTHHTFEMYFREKWGISDTRARQFIDSANAVINIQKETAVSFLPAYERHARPLSQLDPEQQAQAWQQAVDTAPNGKITGAHVQAVVDTFKEPDKRPVSYHVSDDSYEWYTPSEYIEAARGVMGEITLDPASSDTAQQTIQAGTYYTKEDDGLSKAWHGKVWLNPPYNMPLIEQFIDKVIGSYEAGIIEAAIVLTNNSTDTGWFHKLIEYPVCLTRGRIQFQNGDERLATRQGQALFYLGDDPSLFARVFSVFGVVLRKYDNQ